MTTRLTPDQRRYRQVSERDFQATVERIALYNGWRIYHAPDNRPLKTKTGRSYVQAVRAGFPDLVAVRGPRLLFAELKRETGPVKPEQRAWLDDLERAGAEVYLWRPSDLDEVVAVLGGRAA